MGKTVELKGVPDGPEVFVPEYGTKVPTYTQKVSGCLQWHVPPEMRGMFRPNQLSNYEPDKEYRTDASGYVLCYATTTAGNLCNRRAVNRTPKCLHHGGKLHPLDRMVPQDTERELSRYEKFLAKQITVDDLDDEELMAFGFRDSGGVIRKPKTVPRELVNAFTRAIFDRALDKMKSHSLQAAKVLASIMVDPTVDANIRMKAATEILDRTLGKAPQLVSLQANAPWEQIFEGIATLSRDESRTRRGLPVLDAVVQPEEDGAEKVDSPSDLVAVQLGLQKTGLDRPAGVRYHGGCSDTADS